MEGMRSSGAVEDTTHLEARIERLGTTLEEEQADLARTLAPDVPLLANPNLLEAGLKALSDVVERDSDAQASLAATLKSALPDRLFSEPPQPREPLTQDQEKFFRNKLGHLLATFAVKDDGPPSFLKGLDSRRAREIHQRVSRYVAAMATLRQDRARRLRDISAKRTQLTKLQEELREARVGGGELCTGVEK